MSRKRTKAGSATEAKARQLATLMYRDSMARHNLSHIMGYQYKDDRNLYEALGYKQTKDIKFLDYYGMYERNAIANAIIHRPAEETWKASCIIGTPDGKPEESQLSKSWKGLVKKFHLTNRLQALDELSAVGQYSVLLLGLNDVRNSRDWVKPVTGQRELLYLKQVSQENAIIDKYETNAANPRYGLPLTYKVRLTTSTTGTGGSNTQTVDEVLVHHSRLIHINHPDLTSEYLGKPVLLPVYNTLMNLDKILGGDAEMFWRGARPGYHASAKEEYELSDTAIVALEKEIDKYEHDLRRFLTTQGVDIKALEQQIADPINHIDVQLQAISSQTGIPKRILIGSERGELASSQDKGQWFTLIKGRTENFAEPYVLRKVIDRFMELGILPKEEDYVVIWEDVFSPSEEEKVRIGKERANALAIYGNSLTASEILPMNLAAKYLLGLDEDQWREVQEAMEEADNSENNLDEALLEQTLADEDAQRRMRSDGDPNEEPSQRNPRGRTRQR